MADQIKKDLFGHFNLTQTIDSTDARISQREILTRLPAALGKNGLLKKHLSELLGAWSSPKAKSQERERRHRGAAGAARVPVLDEKPILATMLGQPPDAVSSMSSLLKCPSVIYIFLLLVLLCLPEQSFAEESQIFAGAAKIEITPPIGTPLAGYGKRGGKPSKGVLDPLFSRALSVTKDGETFVFVSADLLLIDSNLKKSVVKKVNAQTVPGAQNGARHLSESHVMIFATHTHSGTGAIGSRFWQRFIGGGFDRKVFEFTTDKIAESIVLAVQNETQVSRIEYGEIDAGELIENRMDEKIEVPELVKAVRFYGEGHGLVSQIVLFGAHPTILKKMNRHFSADYAGELAKLLETENPGSVALFAQGASGDLRPSGIDSDYPEKKMKLYAEAVKSKIKSIQFKKVDASGEWKSAHERTRLPRVKLRASFLRVPPVIGNRFFPRRSEFQVFRMGELGFAALPAEASSQVGLEIENLMNARKLMLLAIGYANDYLGYVIPERYYLDSSQYESRASFYGKKFDLFFYKTFDRLLNSISKKESKEGILVRDGLIPVLYLHGSAYEMGFQHGSLMKKEIRAADKQISRYLNRLLYVPGISKWILKWRLNRAWKKMAPYVTYGELMEMKGLADGSGLSFKEVKRLHAIPDYIESFCANGVYFGKATKGEKLIHIRNLDWVKDIGVHRLAAIMVHKPDNGIPYANIGYYGFTGVLSGVNQQGISVGQVGSDSVDETFKGTPMPFLLKRILQNADSLETAEKIITLNPRTSGFNYMIADAKKKEAVAIETTANHFQVFRDNDPKEKAASYGMPIENALLRADAAMDQQVRDLQTCAKGNPKKPGLEFPAGSAYETRYKKQGELVIENYGKIDPEIARKIAQAIAPDSNIQSVVYQFPEFWVANATDELPASETEYHHFNFESLLNDFQAGLEKA